ncbi:MAG TPA: LTA synthase family protein [Stellaceae bacterium]|nr:LTA synthase family protein [Stellaceae bacterium]
MSEWQHIAVGLALSLAGWCGLRAAVGARLRPRIAPLLDASIPGGAFALLLIATGKPVFAGILLAALMAAFAAADRMKRAILREPIVFTDFCQTIDVLFRHPELNMLGSRKVIVLPALAAAVGALASLVVVEPGLWPWSPRQALLAAAIAALAIGLAGGPCLGFVSSCLRHLRPTGEPAADIANLGPFAAQAAYIAIAKAERQQRRDRCLPRCAIAASGRAAAAPVVVVQAESFFDPRGVWPDMPRELLSAFDACRGGSIQHGRLAVPAVGANSVRTEFAMLTGLPEEALGFDRFNPYLAFARQPVRSLAWRLRDEGYRTICLHPFDPRFYRRDLVMKALGFDAFLDEEAFWGAARSGHFVDDRELALRIADIVRDEGPRVFVFAITMQNHGPWRGRDGGCERFLQGIRETDAMLARLMETLERQATDAVLALYGDHPPALRPVLARLSENPSTEYVIWSPAGGRRNGERDLAAHELSAAIWDAWATAGRHAAEARPMSSR